MSAFDLKTAAFLAYYTLRPADLEKADFEVSSLLVTYIGGLVYSLNCPLFGMQIGDSVHSGTITRGDHLLKLG